MKRTILVILLFTALLAFKGYASFAATTVNVSGSCFDAPVELTLYGSTVDNKPAWTGTATIAGIPNTPIALFWDNALGAWLLTFDGQPYSFVSMVNTPKPPNNSTRIWQQVPGTTNLCPVSTPIEISGTGTQALSTLIVLSTPTVTNVSCFGSSTGEIAITAIDGTAPYTYTLNPGNVQNNTGTFTGLPADNYTISVADANNNTAVSGTISVSQPTQALSLNTPTVTDVNCSSPNTGQISITASGGTGPYTYTLSPGNVQNTTGTFPDLTAGDYTVSVVDANNCPASSGTITVDPASSLSFSAPTVTDVGCNGDNTGQIAITASGGTGPYTYTLSPGNVQNTTGTFPDLTAGDYTVSVVDASGCSSSSGTINVVQPPVLTIQSGGNKLVFKGVGSTCTTISATASGGTGSNYSYTWMPGNLSGESVRVCPTETTVYTVTVTDGNSCTASTTVTVTVADVSCGNKNDKVLVCHKGRELCVSPDAVADHLSHGDVLGSCSSGNTSRTGVVTAELEIKDELFHLAVKAYPNPTQDVVTVQIQSQLNGAVQLDLLDMVGRTVQQRTEQLIEGLNEVSIRIGGQPAGMYLLRCRDALGRQSVLKISKN